MAEMKTFHVEPGSELDRLLDAANEHQIELEKDGVRYRVTRVDAIPASSRVTLADERDIWAGYDPGRVREGLRKSEGALVSVDRERLLADLAEQREQDSRGRPG
jgi:hypothetical protein